MKRRAATTGAVQNHAERPVAGQPALAVPPSTAGGSASESRAVGRWELWFPVRLGPLRVKTRMLLGQRVKHRTRTPELPPSSNDGLHRRAKGPWVREWREAARDLARATQIPPCERIRVSVEIRRTRLGLADEDNDR